MRSWQPVGDERRDMYMYAAVATAMKDTAETASE
jgi:hypothetical protein